MAGLVGCTNPNKTCIPSCTISDPNSELVPDPAALGVMLPLSGVPRSQWGILSPAQTYLPTLQASAVTRAMTGQPSAVAMEGTTDKTAHVRSIGNAHGSSLVTDNPAAFSNCCMPNVVMSVSTDTFSSTPSGDTKEVNGYGVSLNTGRSEPAGWFAPAPRPVNMNAAIMNSPVVGSNLN